MIFAPFGNQAKVLTSQARIKGAFAGKRGGKTEVGAIDTILHVDKRPGYTHSEIDPYVAVIMAPTADMLRRLSMRKFLAYAKPFSVEWNRTRQEVEWPNGSVIYGLSSDKPERLEGIKANFIWLDEVFQMSEQTFLEAMARVADTKGKIVCTGSLGVQYNNPKAHWVFKHFKDKPISGSECFEWSTADNPFFPREELERLKDTLDPVSYRQMFEISWDAQGSNLVYDQFSSDNLKAHKYDPSLETYVSIDWGYAHATACLFFQYNPKTDTVYLFDEIVRSRMTLDQLWMEISKRPYKINDWYCDIAGNQEREQTGISNVAWFRQPPRQIHFKYRQTAIAHGVSILRSYIKNTRGQVRFYLDEKSCPKTLDGIRNYSYAEKNGMLINETPVKHDDDAVDSARYFFVNRLDFTRTQQSFGELNRWKLTGSA